MEAQPEDLVQSRPNQKKLFVAVFDSRSERLSKYGTGAMRLGVLLLLFVALFRQDNVGKR